MSGRIDEQGNAIVGNVAIPASLVPAFRELLTPEVIEWEYGDALREANGTVWDHEPRSSVNVPWTSDEMVEKNREHVHDMVTHGEGDDGSRIVQVRRITLSGWVEVS